MIFKSAKQRGIGLLELMLALSIISILIVMATRYFSTVTLSQKINTAHMQLIDIMQGLQHWKSKYGNYNDLNPQTGIQKLAGLISPEIVEKKDPFGSKTASWVVAPQPNGTVTIRLNGITKHECEVTSKRLAPQLRPPLAVSCNNGNVSDLLITGFQ